MVRKVSSHRRSSSYYKKRSLRMKRSCPKGQRRNPSTGYCRKVKTCKTGYHLGPYGRCRKSKPCKDPRKRRNSNGRCVQPKYGYLSSSLKKRSSTPKKRSSSYKKRSVSPRPTRTLRPRKTTVYYK